MGEPQIPGPMYFENLEYSYKHIFDSDKHEDLRRIRYIYQWNWRRRSTTMEMITKERFTQQSLLNELIGKTVVSLARVALEESSSHALLLETLVFIVADGKKFELLTQQATTLFREITGEHNFFVGFELELDQTLKTCELDEEGLDLPFTVDRITDIWAGKGEDSFLVAIILWNADKKSALSICTETDEIELMSIEDLRRRIDYMPFSYGSVQHLTFPLSSETI